MESYRVRGHGMKKRFLNDYGEMFFLILIRGNFNENNAIQRLQEDLFISSWNLCINCIHKQSAKTQTTLKKTLKSLNITIKDNVYKSDTRDLLKIVCRRIFRIQVEDLSMQCYNISPILSKMPRIKLKERIPVLKIRVSHNLCRRVIQKDR